MPVNHEMFTVGKITGTHGLRGEVRVLVHTNFPELRFVKGSKLFLSTPVGSTLLVQVAAARSYKRGYLVSFEGFDSIERVEAFRGCELQVSRAQLPELPPGEYFIRDLVGCEVFDDEGQKLGELIEVLTPGANDVYVVKRVDGSTVLLPAIADCILQVDIQAKRMVVHILPGLLD